MICRVVGSVQTLVAALVCILGLLVGNKSVKQTYKGLAVVYWQIVRLVHNRPHPVKMLGRTQSPGLSPTGKETAGFSLQLVHNVTP